jgi:hypothetical protein
MLSLCLSCLTAAGSTSLNAFSTGCTRVSNINNTSNNTNNNNTFFIAGGGGHIFLLLATAGICERFALGPLKVLRAAAGVGRSMELVRDLFVACVAVGWVVRGGKCRSSCSGREVIAKKYSSHKVPRHCTVSVPTFLPVRALSPSPSHSHIICMIFCGLHGGCMIFLQFAFEDSRNLRKVCGEKFVD